MTDGSSLRLRAGVTLIEVLAAAAILAVVALMTTAGLRSYPRGAEVEAEAWLRARLADPTAPLPTGWSCRVVNPSRPASVGHVPPPGSVTGWGIIEIRDDHQRLRAWRLLPHEASLP